ncbi:MAG: glycosyltransferase family 2 protein, partial [Candidatus Saccharibacteria bacterium]
MSKPLVGIVIPAFNESSSIQQVLSNLPNSINNYGCQIIVVNDGSTDNTADIVTQYKNIILINHLLNSGAGAATRTGLDYARQLGCEFVATMDSDGQHDINDVIKLFNYAFNHPAVDLIIGSRLINSKGMPWYRVLGNKGLSFFTFLVFGIFVTDSQSGLKVFNKKALVSIKFYSNNYAFCSEILWQAHKKQFKIKELPIKAIYSEYSKSKGQSNWNGFNIVRQML